MRLLALILLKSTFLIVCGIDLQYYTQESSWNIFGPILTNHVENFSCKSRNESITTVNGINNTSNNIVKGLIFESSVVNFVPKGIDVFFPNLEGLKIFNSQLKSLDKSDLKPFSKLKELFLDNNDLSILESDLFEFNPNLQLVSFDNNKLKFIGSELLDPLKSLQYAYFMENHCISSYYQQEIYNGLNDLKSAFKTKCSLSDDLQERICRDNVNRLEEATSKLSNKLEIAELKIQRLEALLESCDGNLNSATNNMLLTTNQLESCVGENKEFTSSTNMSPKIHIDCDIKDDPSICIVKNLKIEFKHSAIDKVIPVNTSNVNSLKIIVQQTLFLPTGLADHFKQLEKMEVTKSGLYEVDRTVFTNMNKLTILILSENKLQKIAADSFEDLSALRELDMSNNMIRSLPSRQFRTLENLEKLDLQGNSLVSIEVEVLESLSNLKELFLQKNMLKFISAKLLTPLTQLKLVDFANNSCIDMSHPNASLMEIEDEIIENCIAPIDLDCRNDLNLTSFVHEVEQSACSAKSLTIDYAKTKVQNVLLGDNDESVTVFVAVNQSMKYLPYQLGSTLPNVTMIVVECSKLTTLQKHDFKGFVLLKTIIIRHNNLTKIEEQTFDDATQVEKLDLTFNCIRSLPPKIFLHLTRLTVLILSNNLIESFTADLLPRKNVIEDFWVDNNELEIIETKTLRLLRKSKIIDLTGNVCIDLKFDKSDPGSKTLVELSGEIDLNCSADDV